MSPTNAGTTTADAPARPRRVPFWDNARFACIVLVVLGHAVQRLTAESQAAYALYLLIYAFHMPAFAIMSGYFSRSEPPSRRRMARVVVDLVVPYVVVSVVWAVFEWVLTGTGNPNLTTPSWTLWFLLTLAVFRLVLPYLALLRWPLAGTVVVSIAAGYLPNVDQSFSMARTLGFLPFFTLGWWLRDRDVVARLRLLRPRTPAVVAAAIAVLAGAYAVTWTFAGTWADMELGRWMFYHAPYAEMGGTAWWAGGVRMLLMLVALVLTAAFLVLVPRRRYRWTELGRHTMYVYLLHGFVLWPLREYGVIAALRPHWLWLPLIGLLSLALSVVLASKPVRRLARPLVEPQPAWLFADPRVVTR